MANANSPFGLRPVRRLDGAAPTYQTNPYLISTSYTTKIGTGDLVKLASGYINLAAASDTPVLGVFAGCEWVDSSLQKKVFSPQWTGVTTAVASPTAYVYDDTNMVFEIQSGSGTVVPQSAIGKTAKIVVSSPNASSGISTEVLDDANVAATATFPLKVIGLSQRINNDNTAAYNIVEVVLNNASYKTGIAG